MGVREETGDGSVREKARDGEVREEEGKEVRKRKGDSRSLDREMRQGTGYK